MYTLIDLSDHFDLIDEPEFKKVYEEKKQQCDASQDNTGKKIDLKDWNDHELFSLFEETDIWNLLGNENQKYSPLLKSFNWVKLSLLCQTLSAGKDTSHDILGVQQILCAIAAHMAVHKNVKITEYHLLSNFSDMEKEIRYPIQIIW